MYQTLPIRAQGLRNRHAARHFRPSRALAARSVGCTARQHCHSASSNLCAAKRESRTNTRVARCASRGVQDLLGEADFDLGDDFLAEDPDAVRDGCALELGMFAWMGVPGDVLVVGEFERETTG